MTPTRKFYSTTPMAHLCEISKNIAFLFSETGKQVVL